MRAITIDEALAGTDAISQVRATSSGVYWLASIATEDGRTTIRRRRGAETVDLTPHASVRSRVMEYGGGAYDVDEHVVAFCDDRTSQLFVLDGDQTRPLTPAQKRFRFGGLHVNAGHRLVLAVREDHDATPEPRTEIVALDLDGPNDDGGKVLVTGADFYAGPRIHGDQLAWFQWDHPNMSWDTATTWRSPLGDPGAAAPVVARDGVSAMHPLWLPDGRLAVCDDSTGFWNWEVEGDRWSTAHDCTHPVWVLDAPAACPVDDDTLVSVVLSQGLGSLWSWNRTTGRTRQLLADTAEIESVAVHGSKIHVIAHWAERPATLEVLTLDGERETLASGEALPGPVVPVSYHAAGPAGDVQSFFYSPTDGPAPLLVMTHGGPTAATTAAYDRTKQFWLSRGIAVVDVNYSGSTGFGRAYRERLKGQWGILEVADVVATVQHLATQGLVDPERVVITGGSAGGYTTLRALVSTKIFAAGISRYGIADLTALAKDTHKAESRYLDGLIGPYPEAESLWQERSPLNRLDELDTPMLILQGSDDKVVPPNQAEKMADAVRAKGLPVALLVFEGEGHGFRTMEARRCALEAQVSFVQQILGMEHSDDVPVLTIENR